MYPINAEISLLVLNRLFKVHGSIMLIIAITILLLLINSVVNRKRTMNALEKSENKYRAMFRSMQEGLALLEITNDQKGKPSNYRFIDVNPAFEAVTGLRREDVISRALNEIFPQIEVDKIETYNEVAATGEPAKYERYSKDLEKHLLVNVNKPEENRLALMFIDVTQRKMLEEETLRQKLNFEALFKNSSDAIVLFNQDHEIIDINDKFTSLFGYTLEEVRGREIDSILAFEAKKVEANQLTEDLFSGDEVSIESIRYGSDGQPREVSIKGVPVILNGQIVGGYGIYTDIAERKKAEKEILFMSYHDQLTGLYNRRFFEEELRRLDTERNLPLSIVMADVNGLKLTNDAFGHAMGDQLLKKVAEIITKVCRSDEIVARLSGDEFVILMPKTNFGDAEKIVSRIKQTCQNTKIETIELSISFGWDTKNNTEENIHQVFKNAEDYMYKHKLFESPSMRSRTIKTIIGTLHEKNNREEMHSQRVSHLSELTGIAMSLTEREINELKTVGLLHDIGKIAINENILNKPGKLTKDEWKELKRHSEIGYNILSSVNEMAELAKYVLAHHENWDGTGYPKGLKGNEIPLQARIIKIADAYDAMTSDRPYRNAMAQEEAIKELKENAGTQFDPELVPVFIERVGELMSNDTVF